VSPSDTGTLEPDAWPSPSAAQTLIIEAALRVLAQNGVGGSDESDPEYVPVTLRTKGAAE
jgi:hypothetical protein